MSCIKKNLIDCNAASTYNKAMSQHILIIDDNKELTELLRDVIESNFPAAKVDICYSIDGVEGYSKSKYYSLYCVDYLLPEVNGDKVLELIRSEALNKDAGVIFITGESSFKKGGSPIWNNVEVLYKPLDMKKFIQKAKESLL